MSIKTDNAVIFGAGHLGTVAFFYYRALNWNILSYVDNNQELWGRRKNGLYICSPKILEEELEITVIIANASNRDEIKKQVRRQYGIIKIIEFDICEKPEYGKEKIPYDDEEIIIECRGRLGNQLFCYAVYRALQKKGKKVTFDLAHYISLGEYSEFSLNKILDERIILEPCNILNKQRFLSDENYIFNNTLENRRGGLYKIQKGGYVKGYYFTLDYIEYVKEELYRDIRFPIYQDSALLELAEEIKQKNAVSIHVRRGDFLWEKNRDFYGNICTPQYYHEAIEYIRQNVDSPVFYFLSDDIEAIKVELQGREDYFCVEAGQFNNYQDWYDMYIMSICKHNIIANSTFGFWGAWLNQNSHKIVIAPSKYYNSTDFFLENPKEWKTL